MDSTSSAASRAGLSLKRSSSTASLPTPPRTQRKPRNRKLRRLTGRDSDASGVSSDEGPAPPERKRRRLSKVQEIDDEDAFWLGSDPASAPSAKDTLPDTASPNAQSTARSPSPDVEEGLIFLKREKSAASLASPPPSVRKTRSTTKTLKPKSKQSKSSSSSTSPPIIHDSPNNPFLDSPPVEGEAVVTLADEEPAPEYEEQPHIWMVQRGVRRMVANPWYNPKTGRAKSPPPESLLPIDHPDYIPDMRCKPKALFGQKRKRTKGKGKKAEPKAKAYDPFDSGDEDSKDGINAENPFLLAPGPARPS